MTLIVDVCGMVPAPCSPKSITPSSPEEIIELPHTFGSVVKVTALVLSLGLDTFAVSVGLGMSGLGRRQQLRFGFTFAFAEGVMPLVGFLIGQVVATAVGGVASYVAVALLLLVGLYTIWESRQEEEHEYENASFYKLLVTALSVSLDELAIGFGLGLLHIPILLATLVIAVQAFGLTFIGTTLGHAIGERLAERAELLSGVVLTLLAVFLLGEKLVGA
jgi:putative Mn2+ efflux pump MntP